MPAVTWGEFMAELAKLGVEIKDCKSAVYNHNEEKVYIKYLSRELDGKILRVPIRYSTLNECITPSLLRSICNNLEIDPARFGFLLG